MFADWTGFWDMVLLPGKDHWLHTVVAAARPHSRSITG